MIAKEGFIPKASPVDSTALTTQSKDIRNEVTRPVSALKGRIFRDGTKTARTGVKDGLRSQRLG